MTMSISELLHEPFQFLEPGGDELHKLLAKLASLLPSPYPIYLDDETASPFRGFPVLLTDSFGSLREALAAYLEAEEEAQVAAIRRHPFSRTPYNKAWERYRRQLVEAVQNSVLASYGRNYPTIFWLYHSVDVARSLREVPRRLLRGDAGLGRRYGDAVKYRVFEKLRDNIQTAVYETVRQLEADREELEDEQLLKLLRWMFDNVLVFTEEQVSSDLGELGSFLNGHLHVDAKDFRHRFEQLLEWHREELQREPDLLAVVANLIGPGAAGTPRRLLFRAGYVPYLATRKSYSPGRLFTPEQVTLWEQLLVRLKDFELLTTLRQMVLPVRREGKALVFRAGGLDRTWVGQRTIALSPTTRPLDFFAPAVIDPLVHRYGLIYDISEFSEVVSVLRRAGSEAQEDAFRLMFRFQRRINQLAISQRLQLEKYLGDGAFFTSREPKRILICAIQLQRLYRRALAEGLPFDRGMRIGLNFGHYRLIPVQGGDAGPERYEFFGHGVVELTRLTSGKSRQEVEEIRNVLISYGYPPTTVERFFEPLSERNLDLIDKDEESRPFYAYISRNGSLINEGIVATEEFMAQLSAAIHQPPIYRGRQGGNSYLVLALDDGDGRLYVGLRKLGVAHLKGLEELPVFEILDGADLEEGDLEEAEAASLLGALERLSTPSRTRRPVPAPSSDRSG